MDVIVRGTTPTIKWIFHEIQVGDIVSAIFTIHRKKDVIVEKDMSEAVINSEENSMGWTLTQQESLRLREFQTYGLHCDWLLNNGTRGAGIIGQARCEPTGKDGVIT